MTATNKRPARRNIAALLHVPDRHGLRQALAAFAGHVGGELVDLDDRGLATWSLRAFLGNRLVLVNVCVFTSSRIHSLGLEGSVGELTLGNGSLELNIQPDETGVRTSFPLSEVQPIPRVTDRQLLTERLREVWRKTVARDQ